MECISSDMSSADKLLKTVMRLFYDSASVLLVDILLRHQGRMAVQQMSCLLDMPSNQLEKLIRHLRSECLIQFCSKEEEPDGADNIREGTIYVDYSLAVLAIHWRLDRIQSELESERREEPHVFRCDKCAKEWKALEAWLKDDSMVCEYCGSRLPLKPLQEVKDVGSRLAESSACLADLTKLMEEAEKELAELGSSIFGTYSP